MDLKSDWIQKAEPELADQAAGDEEVVGPVEEACLTDVCPGRTLH